jgi:DivIVA domain-containing protein
MGQFLLLLAGALVVGAIVFGVAVLITGDDPGLGSEEPDGRAVPLPTARPLIEQDIGGLRFDTALRGYRMSQVDAALRRAAYDLGYKDELIEVLEAEITALRDGRTADADALRQSRLAALGESGFTVADDDGSQSDGLVVGPGRDVDTPPAAADPASAAVADDGTALEPASVGPDSGPVRESVANESASGTR